MYKEHSAGKSADYRSLAPRFKAIENVEGGDDELETRKKPGFDYIHPRMRHLRKPLQKHLRWHVSETMHLLALVLCIAIIILWQTVPSSNIIETVAWLYCAASLTWLGATVVSKRQNALSLIVAFYFAVFVAIPAVVQVRSLHFPFQTIYSNFELVSGFGCLAIAQAVFNTVSLIHIHGSLTAPPVGNQPRTALISNPGTWRFLKLFIVLLLTASLVGMTLAGPSSFLTPRFSQDMSGENTVTQIKFITRSLMVVATTIVASLYRHASPVFRNASMQFLAILTIGTFIYVHYPPALARFQLLGGYIAVIVALFPLKSSMQKLISATLGAFFIIYIFHGIKFIGTPEKMFSLIREQDMVDYLSTTDFDSYQQVINAWIYHSQGLQRPLDSVLGTLLFWVPRSIWPGKPQAAGIEVAESLSYPYVNVASPLPAEGLAAAGIFGLICFCLFAALTARWVESKFLSLQGSATLFFPLHAILTGFATIILRGSLTATVPMFGTAIVAAAAIVPGYYFYRASLPKTAHRGKYSHSAKQVV